MYLPANGSTIPIEGCIDLKFSMKGQKLHAIILVFEPPSRVHVGIDWLSEKNVNWKFVESKLKLNGQIVHLTRRPSRIGVRRICVREKIVIPPDTAANVPVKLLSSSFRRRDADWLVNTKALTDTVFVARVVLPNQDEHAAIQIVNLFEETVHIRRGHQPWLGPGCLTR